MQFSLFNIVAGKVVDQKCTKCDLCNNSALKTNCMSGAGPVSSQLMFVGKNPAAEDDSIAEPMTGKNGRLFRELLYDAQIPEKSIYITNCIKCSSHGKELKDKYWKECKGHLKAEIAKIKPKALVAVGHEALRWLTGYSGVRKLRRHGLPCLIDDNLLVFPMIQPAQLFHAADSFRPRMRSEMVEDLVWLRQRCEAGELARQDELPVDYKTAETVQDVKDFLAEFDNSEIVFADLETSDTSFTEGRLFPDETGQVICIGFSKGPQHGRAIPLRALGRSTMYWWTDADYPIVLSLVQDFLSKKSFCGHNWVQFDQKWIRHTFKLPRVRNVFDTMYGHYILDSEADSYGLEDLARLYTTMTPWKKAYQCRDTAKLAYYQCRDVDATARVYCEEIKQFSPKQFELMRDLVLPLGNSLRKMEERGIAVDPNGLNALQTYLDTRLAEELAAMKAMDPVKAYEFSENKAFNPMSNDCLSVVMGKYFKFPNLQKTEGGKTSVNASVLEALKHEPFVSHLQPFKRLNKLRGTYCEGIRSRLRKGRIHTKFGQVTSTGRLNSEDPNLQNFPRNDTAGKVLADPTMVKGMFSAAPGYCLLEADQSQAELRTLTGNCYDPVLIKAYNEDQDVHAFTAAKIYNVTLENVLAEMRDAAKRVNFGIIYGRTLESISEQFEEAYIFDWLAKKKYQDLTETQVRNKALKDAKEFYDGHQQMFPDVWKWMKQQETVIRTQGYQETRFGRRRYYEEITNHAIRAAYNFPIQSEASDFTLRSISRCTDILEHEKLDAWPILTIHDSILFEIKIEQFWAAAEVIKFIMETQNLSWFKIPLRVDMKAGYQWGRLRKVSLKNRTIG